MPHFYAHYKVGHMAKRALNIDFKDNEEIFTLGCQGFDIFFYHNFLSVRNNARKLGHKMHQMEIDGIFRHMIEYAQAAYANKEALFAYTCGVLCHYALDAAAHPYVYRLCGNGRSHVAFEAYIDAQLLKMDGLGYSDFIYYKMLELDRASLVCIDHMYQYMVPKVFGMVFKKGWMIQAVKNMRFIYRLAYDKSGRLKRFVCFLEKIISMPERISFFFFPHCTDMNIDAMNLEKRAYCMPWDEADIENYSFLEMIDIASVNAAQYIAAAKDAVMENGSIEDAMRIIGGRAFHTGRDWREIHEFKYFGNGLKDF